MPSPSVDIGKRSQELREKTKDLKCKKVNKKWIAKVRGKIGRFFATQPSTTTAMDWWVEEEEVDGNGDWLCLDRHRDGEEHRTAFMHCNTVDG